jgi:ATP-binding cassette subfamily B protein
MTRDIERGTRAVHSLISFSLYSILPTLIEVAGADAAGREVRRWFAGITGCRAGVYIAFTVR